MCSITIENNLEGLFRHYDYRFRNLSTILKNYNSSDPKKRDSAEKLYINILGEAPPVDPELVRQESAKLANIIKEVISPVVIRRNRLDLQQDHQYREEVGALSKIKAPEELFYYLNSTQSEFYDRIVSVYFAENGSFTGAIYQPANYEFIVAEDNIGMEDNRRFLQQRNLYDFMRRLLVKRFESSFGAFEKSIERFIKVHELVLDFIDRSGGKYILDRDLIEKLEEFDEEEILETLYKFENDLLERKIPKNNTVYKINKFQRKEAFLDDIRKDLILFQNIRDELHKENLVEEDPKVETVYTKVSEIIKKDPDRKVILFTEYVDTVKHLESFFREKFGNKVLLCEGKITKTLARDLERNFNAQYGGTQHDDFQILITSDKLSEGVNLNRAGAIINYDIPWNPTRVIQRVGRINRIGQKVFDELFIYNFFPSEIGADFVKSKEIAQQKMFMIHNALGEDARIFDPEEKPTASWLYTRINENPEDEDEINILTKVRNTYDEIVKNHPEVIERIEKLPNRVKTAKKHQTTNVNVLRRKGLSLFAQQADTEGKIVVENLLFETFLDFVKADLKEKRLPLSEKFWPVYEEIKKHKENIRSNKSDLAIENRAHDNLKVALKIIDASEEEDRKSVV